jgi:hypothetical protein
MEFTINLTDDEIELVRKVNGRKDNEPVDDVTVEWTLKMFLRNKLNN